MAAVTTEGDKFDPDAMQTLIAEKLARFKQPKAVHVLAEFPRNAMGKILKNELRDAYRDSFVQTPSFAGLRGGGKIF